MNKSARRCVFCTASKTCQIGLRTLVWKRTLNTYNISSFRICFRLFMFASSWETSTSREKLLKLSILFSQCQVSLCERNAHAVCSFLVNVGENCCSISAQKSTKQIFSRFVHNLKTPTRTWNGTCQTMQMSYSFASDFPVKIFCTLAKRAETIRNHQTGFGYD